MAYDVRQKGGCIITMGSTHQNQQSLTPFGVYMRKLRLDHGEYQRDMAERLDVTISYLSAVERGRRNVPNDWVDRLGALYDIPRGDRYILQKAASESRTYDRLDISHLNFEDKRLIGEIATALPNVSRDVRDALNACVTGKMLSD